ncbi:MAG: aminotransferase class V-fold PLP-dependent enzyme [Cyanobacteria bacterium P01_G01_bin.54]
MDSRDTSFLLNDDLHDAIKLLQPSALESLTKDILPDHYPEQGLGEAATLRRLAPYVLGEAAPLADSLALAHMDPPTPWITWATALWNARLNQNLLHPATAPFAIAAEKKVVNWLIPYFGMDGGHFCSGSTLANLTALWAARDAKGIKRIVTSAAAHLSVQKSARILGLPCEIMPINDAGQMILSPSSDLSDACLVLTAGTTATGTIDPLTLIGQAAWTHVDAAWAGALRLSPTYRPLLVGIEQADSIAVSAHKWFFQPKESALVLFRNRELANAAISFGGSYLTEPNIGVQGSRGAAAVSLLATLIAWGQMGLSQRIDGTMAIAQQLSNFIRAEPNLELFADPQTGITVFRSQTITTNDLLQRLPIGLFSTCIVQDEVWLRSVAANPLADIKAIIDALRQALESSSG